MTKIQKVNTNQIGKIKPPEIKILNFHLIIKAIHSINLL